MKLSTLVHNNGKAQKSTKSPVSEAKGLRLKRLRKMANLERRQLAVEYQVNYETLKGWENGKHGGLTPKRAKFLLSVFEKNGVICGFEWLMFGIGDGPQVAKENNAGSEHAVIEQESFVEDSDCRQIQIELNTFHEGNKNAIDYYVQDDCMLPCYRTGDYVAGVKLFGRKIRDVIGMDCIVQLSTGEILLRTIRLGDIRNRYTLLVTNPQTMIKNFLLANVEVISAAPVIWQRCSNPFLDC